MAKNEAKAALLLQNQQLQQQLAFQSQQLSQAVAAAAATAANIPMQNTSVPSQGKQTTLEK